MFIRKKDLSYFYSLLNCLDKTTKRRFVEILQKECCRRSGETEISEIEAIEDDALEEQEIDTTQLLTRTLIKKALRAAKNEG